MNKIDGYSDFVQFVQNFLLKGNNTTAIVDGEVGYDVLQYFYEDSIFTVKDISDEDDEILSISKIGNRIIVEYPYNMDGELVSIDAEHILLMEDCIVEEDIKKLDAKEIIIIHDADEEDDIEDYSEETEEVENEIIEDIVLELLKDLDNLTEEDCIHCLLKKYIEKAYYIGAKNGYKDLATGLKDLLDDIIIE